MYKIIAMKVKDLIEKLEKVDPEAEVITSSSNFELKFSKVSVSNVMQFETGKKEKRGFFDAFDGESYEREIWSVIGGEENVVILD